MKSSLLKHQSSAGVTDYGTTKLGMTGQENIMETSNDKRPVTSMDYDTALTHVGYGRWHWMLAWVCGWANASDAVELLAISFLLPSAQCELELTNLRKSVIVMIGFVGMLIGGFLWGTLGKDSSIEIFEDIENI